MKKTPTKTATLTGTFGSLLAATTAQGAIEYYNAPVMAGNGSGPVQWDIDGTPGSTNMAFHTASTGVGLQFNYYTTFKVLSSSGKGKNTTYGANVSSAGNFLTTTSWLLFIGTNSVKMTGFSTDVPGYIGFAFQPDSTLLYGWAKLTLTFGGGINTVTIHEWAYQDDGSSITVGEGAIPEPESVALGLAGLALGAAGLRRWRKQRTVASK